MSRWAFAIAISATLAACESATDCLCLPVNDFSAALTGDNVVPPVTTAASGSATFHINGSALDYTIAASNLTPVESARLHVGTPLENGTAWVTFCSPCTRAGGVLAQGRARIRSDSAANLFTSMRAFGTYVEIRSASGPVLRGHVRIEP